MQKLHAHKQTHKYICTNTHTESCDTLPQLVGWTVSLRKEKKRKTLQDQKMSVKNNSRHTGMWTLLNNRIHVVIDCILKIGSFQKSNNQPWFTIYVFPVIFSEIHNQTDTSSRIPHLRCHQLWIVDVKCIDIRHGLGCLHRWHVVEWFLKRLRFSVSHYAKCTFRKSPQPYVCVNGFWHKQK